MKILFISGREPSYVRNAMILKCLARNGVEIIDCSDSSTTYPVRFLKVIRKFLSLKNENFDCVFVGFLGQPLVPIIRLLTSKPIVFDAFLSTYDTMCFDRKTFSPGSLAGKSFYLLDKYSCKQADRILLDTDAHIDYFMKTFGLPRKKFRRVFVGADESIFYPRESRCENGKFKVFYYASFLPLHGTEYVVKAAAALTEQKDIEFTVVGKGLEHKKVIKLAGRLGLDNIRFIDWIPYEQLPLEIAGADVCLGGHFSNIDKAKRVIAGKTFQFIAMKKPVIVGDCAGNRELFADRHSALFVKMADAGSLAEGIMELRDNATLKEMIAEAGYNVFMEKCCTAAIGREIEGIFSNLTTLA